MPTASYAVHGLCVRSEIALPLAPAAGGAQPRVEVVLAGSAPVPDEPGAGESFGSIGEPPARAWWTRDGETWLIRFAGRCELRIAPPCRTVAVEVDPGAPPEVVADRVVKTGVLFALERQGEHFLHASAVRTGGTTVALVGTSGSGKSTLAALLCADGGELVSDDQLRVAFDGGGVTCHPGLDAIRLRTEVRELAMLVGDEGEPTWDGKTAVVPAMAGGPHRLDVLALPVLGSEQDKLRVDRLTAAQAMLALAGTRATPRLPEWLVSRFDTHASLVERLPAFRILLPFGSVPDAGQRAALLERLRAAAA